MQNTPFYHPFRIDAATFARITTGIPKLLDTSYLPGNVRFLAVNPTVFTHAYMLLGSQPQRFTSDLSLYLSTVQTFFNRVNIDRAINVPSNANSDARRRLSEDLGVALAAFFMTELLGVGWESISQIPQNSKLSKKRPDFQGYTAANDRYLFEAKGTTNLMFVEKTMSKALTQVKNYPEVAVAKLAVVSYLCADERYFPSTSFVVDPPALPEEVKSDEKTSKLLHFEKVLQFAGFQETSKDYIVALSHKLRTERRQVQVESAYAGRNRSSSWSTATLGLKFLAERQASESTVKLFRDVEFIGRETRDNKLKIKAFFGADKRVLDEGVKFSEPTHLIGQQLEATESAITSVFPDGTFLQLTELN